jgi:hypothetical protein
VIINPATFGRPIGHVSGTSSSTPLFTPKHGQGIWAGLGESGGEPVTTANVGYGRGLSGGLCREWLPSGAPAYYVAVQAIPRSAGPSIVQECPRLPLDCTQHALWARSAGPAEVDGDGMISSAEPGCPGFE